MTITGLITSDDRDLLHRTADTVHALPLPGCADLAAACHHATQGPLRPDSATRLAALAGEVHRTLVAETAADRWLTELEGMGLPLPAAMDTAAALVAERTAQAGLVAAVRDLAERLCLPGHVETRA